MTTDITLFAAPQPVATYLQTSPVAQVLQDQMEGGLAGRQINRISLRNGKFRFLKKGVEIAAVAEKLQVVIVAANPAVGRAYYIKAFNPDDTGQRPDCYSRDGVKPEADSPALQSTTCSLCPQNAKGSAKNGEGKACAFKKRTVIVSPTNIGGDAYAVDMGSMSMFGDENAATRQFNMKSYIEALKSNGLIIPAVVTQLTFDDAATVPKLHFTPIRVLTEAEFRQVEARVNDPAVRDMLDDIDNKEEEGKPVNASPQIAAPAAPAPVVQPAPAAVQPAVPVQQVAPQPVQRRGRPPKAETPPVDAPPPQAAPAAGFPPAQTAPAGFPAAAPAQAAPAAPAAPAGVPGFSINLDEFDQ